MSDFLTANITYKGIEDKGLTITLLDENKFKWTIWKKDYNDKEADSEVYRALQNYKFGDSFGVSYLEKDEQFTNNEGKVVKFKRKTIYSIMPLIKNPTTPTATQVVISQQRGKSEATEPSYESEGVDWDEIAVGKCQTAFLAAYIQSGKTISDAKLQVTQARQLAELVVYGMQKTTGEEIKVEDIPF